MHANRPVQTVDEIKGLRLHVQTRFAADAVQALGAHAVPMPMAQLPIAIGQHVIDGCVDPWDAVPALKLDDLLKTHTDFADSSLSTTTFVLAMNKPAYDRLPADLKTVIDDNSGQVAAGMAGAMWDLQAAAVADMVSQRGEVITTLMPEAVAHWRKATEPVIAAWLKQMKEHKVDGDKLMASAQRCWRNTCSSPNRSRRQSRRSRPNKMPPLSRSNHAASSTSQMSPAAPKAATPSAAAAVFRGQTGRRASRTRRPDVNDLLPRQRRRLPQPLRRRAPATPCSPARRRVAPPAPATLLSPPAPAAISRRRSRWTFRCDYRLCDGIASVIIAAADGPASGRKGEPIRAAP